MARVVEHCAKELGRTNVVQLRNDHVYQTMSSLLIGFISINHVLV